MIAPRRSLWDSPHEAVDLALDLLELQSDDVVYDIGCGDGRFVVEAALRSGAHCVGIEIEEKRAEEARQRVKKANVEDLVQIRCENALTMSTLSEATAVYLYLVPRGLRLLLPELIQNYASKPRRIVTYMSPFPEISYSVKRFVTPSHQPNAKWPLFLYTIPRATSSVSVKKQSSGQGYKIK
uniref:Methyltransferase domain-containing protein n=1 Tax=Aureoumbra lagunensis TaxID=44058 RepID=A0A7S3JYL2_9STRA|mmetsp:Transcript_5608/g.7950  ORF Transcript_5608/g.7950 Transcript_5608/m.7950 type:complete len:182 (-) Transcript_5608:11-556(-)